MSKQKLERENCCYYYQEVFELCPMCHHDESPTPCEDEDDEPYPDDEEPGDIDDDMGYDPFSGSYTGDC